MTHSEPPDDNFAVFQVKYANWNHEYREMWKHVQEMKGFGEDVLPRIVASSFVAKNGELQEMRNTFGLKDAADLARKIHHVCVSCC